MRLISLGIMLFFVGFLAACQGLLGPAQYQAAQQTASTIQPGVPLTTQQAAATQAIANNNAAIASGQAGAGVVTVVSPLVPPPWGEVIAGIGLVISTGFGVYQKIQAGNAQTAATDLAVLHHTNEAVPNATPAQKAAIKDATLGIEAQAILKANAPDPAKAV